MAGPPSSSPCALPSPDQQPPRRSLRTGRPGEEADEGGDVGEEAGQNDSLSPASAAQIDRRGDLAMLAASERSVTRRRSCRSAQPLAGPAGQEVENRALRSAAHGAGGRPDLDATAERTAPVRANAGTVGAEVSGNGRTGNWSPTSTLAAQSASSVSRSSSFSPSGPEELEAAPCPRPRFRDPPPTAAPVPPPPTRWQRLQSWAASVPPIRWVASIGWKSNRQLEKGLLSVLASNDETAVAEYRSIIIRCFNNRLIAELVASAAVFSAVYELTGTDHIIALMWFVVIVIGVAVNQFMSMRRLLNIIDNTELHAVYVHDATVRLHGGIYDRYLMTSERRYSDDPINLPDPPPVYNTASAVPPAYNSPPTMPKPYDGADERAGSMIPMVPIPNRPETTAPRPLRAPRLSITALEPSPHGPGNLPQAVFPENAGVGGDPRLNLPSILAEFPVASSPSLEKPPSAGDRVEGTATPRYQPTGASSGAVETRSSP